MGAWGTGIMQDDTTLDVVGDFEECLKSGLSIAKSTDNILENYSEVLDDTDDGPLIWLALASIQWKYGSLEERVLAKVRSDIENKNGLDLWSEDPNDLKKRKAVLQRFLAKIETPNAKPSRLPEASPLP